MLKRINATMRLGRFPNIPAAGHEDAIPDGVSDGAEGEGANEDSRCREGQLSCLVSANCLASFFFSPY